MKNNILDNAIYDGYNGFNEVVTEKKQAVYIDKPIDSDDTLTIAKYEPLTVGWHLIDIKAIFTREFENGKNALAIKYVLCDDETETERTQAIFFKPILSSLRESKNLPKNAKAKMYLGKVYALFTEYVPDNQPITENKSYINISYFSDKPMDDSL